MKTRIQMVEYNNGKKKFLCQEYKVFIDKYMLRHFPILSLLLAGNWVTMTRLKDFPAGVTKAIGDSCFEEVAFDTLGDAKNYLNIHVSGYEKSKQEEFGNKVKKRTNIKHP